MSVVTIFTAASSEFGNEPYVTDGTPAGTRLLLDLNPGLSGSNPRNFTQLGTAVLFSATTPDGGQELWSTDGTATGTFRVKDIVPGEVGSNPEQFTKLADQIIFQVTKDDETQLWITDGTASGTTLLTDFGGGAFDGRGGISQIGVLGEKAIFSVEVNYQEQIWLTDGTTAGTTQLNVPVVPYQPNSFVILGDKLVFSAFDYTNGYEIWSSDGTPGGTMPLKDISPGYESSYAGNFTVVGDKVVFSARGPEGHELWATDGSADGTVLLKDINPGPNDSNLYAFVSLNEEVYFTAYDGVAYGLWKTNGTAAGTTLIVDFSNTARPFSLVTYNGQIAFIVREQRSYELWLSDGTAQGTALIADLVEEQPFKESYVSDLTAMNGKLLFAVYGANDGSELWSSDGTSAGTGILANINTGTDGSFPGSFVALGDRLIYRAFAPETGYEIWTSDGTEAGTMLLKDLAPGQQSGFANSLKAIGSKVFFNLYTEDTGQELWVTDGTSAGTRIVKDIEPGPDSSNPYQFLGELNGNLVFVARTAATGAELWISDGTEAGTTLLKDIYIGTEDSRAGESGAIAFGGKLYFVANSADAGFELWSTDGTSDGTAIVADIASGADSNYAANFKILGNKLLFTAYNSAAYRNYIYAVDATHGSVEVLSTDYASEFITLGDRAIFTAYSYAVNRYTLWSTDGTASGTVEFDQLPEQSTQFGYSSPSNFIKSGNSVFFQTIEYNFQSNAFLQKIQIWVTDGTDTGTNVVKSFDVGNASSGYRQFVLGDKLLFTIFTPETGVELWSSDGTQAGTILVGDIAPGTSSSNPSQFVEYNGRVVFTASSPASGTEVWITDGTPGGTNLLSDIRPGSDPSDAREFTELGGKLYFSASDGVHGSELWVTDGTQAGTHLVADGNTSGAGSDPRYLTVVTLAGNSDPTGTPSGGLAAGNEDTIYQVSPAVLLQGFSDADNDPLTVTNLRTSAGSVVITAGGDFRITPPANFDSVITLTFDVSDGQGGLLRNQNRTFNLNAVNDAPVALDTTATTAEDAVIAINVASLISDVDSETLTVTAAVPSAQGIVSVAGTIITFTPALNFNGPASITYTVTDDANPALSDTGTIAVNVTSVNDAPTLALTSAITALSEATSTAAPLKIADIVVSDDATGTNFLALAGADAALFEIAGSELRLKAGAVLDFETNPVLDVTITVDDPSIGSGIEALTSFAIAVRDANEKPVVTLVNSLSALSETTPTNLATKVADIVVSDDVLGFNQLSLSGTDAALFEIVGSQLRLKAGVGLDFETKPILNVTASVDDASLGTGPEAQASIAVTITDVMEIINGTSRTDTLNGTIAGEIISGFNGHDRIDGRGGNDHLLGGTGNDTLTGGDGDDILDGGSGVDKMAGGLGNDTYVLDTTRDSVTERAGEGIDTVITSVSLTLGANIEIGLLSGAASNSLTGNGLANLLTGNNGNNTLRGLDGGDVINGGAGNDRIFGGTGVDRLTGGEGGDVFAFAKISEAGNGAGSRDIITDFAAGVDRIGLSDIDASAARKGNQAFSFIGTNGFAGVAGQLNVLNDGGNTIVQGDINGDGRADFQIELTGLVTLTSADFIL